MSRRSVAIFGSTGQLGSDLVEVSRGSASFDVIPLTHEDADCTDAGAVRKVLIAARPQIVINSAAYVRVDDCEDHAQEAFQVNAIGAFHIAKTCAEIDAQCVYVSTDYVFDGTKATPYLESDMPCPINVYGASKLAGEHLVRQATSRSLIIRVASLFGKNGARGKGGNFIETILNKAAKGEALKVVNDIRISPTYSRDAALSLLGLLEAGTLGVVHVTNSGSCSWYELAKTTLRLCAMNVPIEPVSSSAFPTRARRPQNSALISGAIEVEKLGRWQDAVRDYLMERGVFRGKA